MKSADAYSLFLHGLNPQLCRLVGTLVTSRELDAVITVVKKATVYGEDKGSSYKSKIENKQNG